MAKGTYYDEKNRALRYSDHLINEFIYVKHEELDLVKLELEIAPTYRCNFMKVFKDRLQLYMQKDSNLVIDGKRFVRLNKVVSRPSEVGEV